MSGGKAFRIPRIVLVVGLIVAVYEWALFASSGFAPGAIGPNYHGIGTDWMVFHAAARRFLAGDLAGLYAGVDFTIRLNRDYAPWLFDSLDYRPWVNPPWFLLMLVPFGTIPFVVSFIAGQISQFALLGTAMRRVFHTEAAGRISLTVVAACLLSPAAAINALAGQTALLACTLAVVVLVWGDRRAWLAGIALALLSYKPQLGLVLVVYVLASRQFAVMGWAMVTGLGLVALSSVLVGWQSWLDWLGVIAQGLSGSGMWNEAGRLWGNSVYTCLYALGVPERVASLVQLAVSLLCLAAAAIIARRDADHARRIAAVLLLMLLGAPYFAAYDTVIAVAALAIAFTGSPSLAPASLAAWSVPLMVWLIPFASPPLINPSGTLTPLILTAALMLLYREVRLPDRPGQLGYLNRLRSTKQ